MSNIIKELQISEKLAILLLILFSVFVFLPVLIFGFPQGNSDIIHHLQISNAYYESLKNGILYPDWVATENNGYGSITVRFYPPLTQYIWAIFRLIFGSWFLAGFLFFVFWSFIGGLGIYRLAKDILGNQVQALAAAFLFIFAPYHLNQFYNSFLFSEFVSLSIFPFLFLFTRRVCKDGKMRDVLWFTVSLTLFILSNLPQVIIGAVIIGFYILFFLKKENFLRISGQFLVSGVLALICSSFYWVRMLLEKEWIKINFDIPDAEYQFYNNYLLSDFTIHENGLEFASLIFAVLLILTALAIIVSKSFKSIRTNNETRGFFYLFIFSSVMMLNFSYPIWNNLTFLQRAQFPWRFLSANTICFCLLFAYCLGYAFFSNFKQKRPILMLLVGLMLIYATFSIKQVALGAAVVDSKGFETMAAESAQAPTLPQWWTIWTQPDQFKNQTLISAGNRHAETQLWEATSRNFTVEKGEATETRIATQYYPHWKVSVNGEMVETLPAKDGAISFHLPEKESLVEMNFVEPQSSLLSRKVSIAGVLLVAILLLGQVFLSLFSFTKAGSYGISKNK